jgi:hypothetical protein
MSLTGQADGAHRGCLHLEAGAGLAFNNWDRDRTLPGYLSPLADHRSLLEQAGFKIETYQLQPEAETKRRAVYEAILAGNQGLVRDMGEEAAARLIFEAKARSAHRRRQLPRGQPADLPGRAQRELFRCEDSGRCSSARPDPFFRRLRAVRLICRSAWAAPFECPAEKIVT